jgi:hypothetical protein
MITKENAPVGWAMLMYELEDAKEHLAQLISDVSSAPEYGEEAFRVDLGHVFSHLNRAWHRRNTPEDLNDAEWEQASQYPTDLSPT